MAQAPVPAMTDQFALLEERLQTLNKVLTTKAAIAQTPKELVWTLNKAKLYRYIPVVPKKASSGSPAADLRAHEPALYSRPAA